MVCTILAHVKYCNHLPKYNELTESLITVASTWQQVVGRISSSESTSKKVTVYIQAVEMLEHRNEEVKEGEKKAQHLLKKIGKSWLWMKYGIYCMRLVATFVLERRNSLNPKLICFPNKIQYLKFLLYEVSRFDLNISVFLFLSIHKLSVTLLIQYFLQGFRDPTFLLFYYESTM